MISNIPEEVAVELLKKSYNAAAFVLNDPDKFHSLIQSVSSSSLDLVQEFVGLVQDYPKSSLPFESVQLIVAALLYVQSDKDLVPDWDPELGLIDDYAVLLACKKRIMKN